MTNTQSVVLDLLGKTLFQYDFDPEKYEEINWNEVYVEAHKQTVIPTIIESVPDSADKNLRFQLINDDYEFEKHRYKVTLGHKEIHRIMQKNSMPYVFLKGIASGTYYPYPYQRSYGDVDFLVPKERKDEVEEILLAEGFNKVKSLPYEADFEKDDVSYDVHFEIYGMPEGSCGEYLTAEMNQLIENSVTLDVDGTKLNVPVDYAHGLILLTHLAKHLVGFGAGLRQLCDWAVFANYIGERFQSMFEEKLKAAGLWKFAKIMSAACVRYLHMPAYSWIGELESDIIERFMDDLMRKGNIRHDGNDDMDSVFVENANHGGAAKNAYVSLYKNLAWKVCCQWPSLKKIPIFIPFGIIWMCIRYVFGVCTGTYKKINLLKTMDKASERRQLYRELQLFEGEKA